MSLEQPRYWRRFLRSSCPKVVHNASFERIWSLRWYGCQPKNLVWDTSLSSKLINENTPNHLEHLAMKVGMPHFKSESAMKTEEEGWENQDIFTIWERNCADTDATVRVYEDQLTRDVRHVDRWMGYDRVLVNMRNRGMRVLVEDIPEIRQEVQAELESYTKEMLKSGVIRQYCKRNKVEFNPRSTKQLREIIFDWIGMKPLEYSFQTREPKVNSDFLEEVIDDHDIIPPLMRYRELDQLRKNFLGPLERTAVDGIVHPNWNVGGTRTWRLSSSEPNLQNIAKRKESAEKIRRLFIARPGMSLVQADYSQIELRILASLSDEDNLLDAFGRGEDPHARAAADLFGRPIRKVTKEEREKGKRLNFGVGYGIQPRGLRVKFKIPEEEGIILLKKYWKLMTGISYYMKQQWKMAQDKGYVESPFGMRRHFPPDVWQEKRSAGHAKNAAGNMPVQSAAGEITLMAMEALEPVLQARGAYMVAQVHDSILVECPVGQELTVGFAMRSHMVNIIKECPWMKVPFEVDVEYGPDWFDLKPIEIGA